MKKFFKKKVVWIVLISIVVINIFFYGRMMSQVWDIEMYCTQNLISDEEFNKNREYLTQKISPTEYTERERRLVQMTGNDISQITRDTIKCQETREEQIKYFIFF